MHSVWQGCGKVGGNSTNDPWLANRGSTIKDEQDKNTCYLGHQGTTKVKKSSLVGRRICHEQWYINTLCSCITRCFCFYSLDHSGWVKLTTHWKSPTFFEKKNYIPEARSVSGYWMFESARVTEWSFKHTTWINATTAVLWEEQTSWEKGGESPPTSWEEQGPVGLH